MGIEFKARRCSLGIFRTRADHQPSDLAEDIFGRARGVLGQPKQLHEFRGVRLDAFEVAGS